MHFAPLLLAFAAAPAVQDTTEAEALFTTYFERYLELFPSLATEVGNHTYDNRFENEIAAEHIDAQRALHREFLERALKLDREGLDNETNLELDLFVDQRRGDLEELALPGHLLPLNSFDCTPYTFARMGGGGSVHPFESVSDYENFLARIDGFEAWVDTAIASMNDGMERGIVLPRVIALGTVRRLRELAPEDPHESPFYGPVRDLPAGFSAADRERLTAAYLDAIEERLTPLYLALAEFVADVYAPACRDSLGWTALPGGREWYEKLVRQYTTTDETPEAIFDLGEREVKRIGTALRSARERAKEREPTIYDSPAEAAAAYAALLESVEERVGALFDVAPRTPLVIRPTDHGTFYEPGAPDGSRPGVYYFEARGAVQISEATFAHEAIPGHHYQIMLQRESEQPAFRRNYLYFAFIEGWGLYAESLGDAVGLYEDPHQEVARLQSEMWRALRLVWDVGLHAKGWSFEDCAAYAEPYGFTLAMIRKELERYVAWPAQALSYKVGEQRILALRERAREALGEDFDLRTYHALVLRTGAVPLHLLERRVERWLAEQTAERR